MSAAAWLDGVVVDCSRASRAARTASSAVSSVGLAVVRRLGRHTFNDAFSLPEKEFGESGAVAAGALHGPAPLIR